MSAHLQRAQLLYQQARFEPAAGEIRQALIEQPNDAYAHALLGLCLMRQDELPEAQAETEQAIVLAPDEPYPHYCQSIVLSHRNRNDDAEQSAREAVRLDPWDVDYYAQLAVALFKQKQWQESLDAANEGLQYDAEHAGCNNLRTMALTQLGRRQESLATVDAALARNPDNELAHTNKGWALLHDGKPKPALEHFREALRLDPNYEYAQAGVVEALKARHLIYRWMLAYFLWMSRLDNRVKWGIVLGGWFGYQILSSLTDQHPELTPWTTPLILLYLGFVLLTWFSQPLFNLLLRLNKYGRHALSRDQRMASNWFGLCVFVALASLVGYALSSAGVFQNAAFAAGVFAAGMALPLVTCFYCDPGWPRQAMKWFTVAMAAAGGVGIATDFLTPGSTYTRPLLMLFLFGFIATPWVANFLASATVKR